MSLFLQRHADFVLHYLETKHILALNINCKAMGLFLQNRSGDSLDIPFMSAEGEFGWCIHHQLLRSSEVLRISQKLAFFACSVCNAIVNANGDGNAKSPPQVHSMARWERRTALVAAVSPMAAEHCGWESEVHTDAIVFFIFVFARFFCFAFCCFTGI